MSAPLLAAEGVQRAYGGAGLRGRGARRVLEDVDLVIEEGACVALLGASGSGKSTLARLLLGLERPDAGHVRYRGTALPDLTTAARRGFRAAVQAVLQDPFAALNPRHTIGRSVTEPLRHLTRLGPAERAERVDTLLTTVGLDPAWRDRMPGQVSGGQAQRVCIARALASDPTLVILDEAVSNLDVPLQLAILDHLAGLRRERGTAFLLITHDVRLARRFADRIVVMDAGRIVDDVAAHGALRFTHPAARALMAAVLPGQPGRGAR